MNSLNDAISVVHEPDSCSVISLISLAGKMARTGVEDLVSVFFCRLIGVDFQGGQSRHLFDGGDSVADRCPEDLGDIACRIGADQQNSLALSGQVDSCGTRDACLAHTALASEEEVPWGLSKEFHHHNLPWTSTRSAAAGFGGGCIGGVTASADGRNGQYGL